MRGKTADVQRLQHIADAISEIETFTKNVSYEAYAENRMLQLACVKCLEIIGEAAAHVSSETKAAYPGVEWQKMKDFRNLAVHEYFNVSTRLVWQIIETNIPELKTELRNILENLNT